ncbi:LytR/AlgR family response regulator transcription factor [Ruminococcus sp.]|uniref:LytR/AlgR family response regulator transcription factor n=1 Tax=Ruminococcus sp. TaxID=41978 RepID=UPI002E797470|nr:LytTR family DNA-binding domain-containing protein [Ruminococcus sp.]MEE0023279.1 LytTR family DNA-binding domain-containing protein [Ruminococcus sp.]
MIKIAVVDDENIICSYVEQSLLNLSKKYGISIETDVFNSGEDLIKTIKETFYDVIFLDIKMKDLSGIDISRIIRNTMGNEAIQIIYISGNTEYAIEVFEYDPFHFLPKPLNNEKIENAFVKLIHKLRLKSEAFTYKVGHDSVKVAIKNILYFESNKRKIIIHYSDKKDEFYGSLENILQQLGKYNFLHIHKSYLVNPVHVHKCTYESVEMSNHVVLPIAQSKRKEIREKQLELVNCGEA